MERINARREGEHTHGGVDTGYSEFDHLTGGLRNGELIILAARPSMGKTALALNMAENVAVKYQTTTLVVSLEMSSLELGERMICSHARVNSHHVRNGTLRQEQLMKLIEASERLSESPLYIDDSPSRTVTEIAAAGRRLKRKGRLGLIVIDYLQLIEPDNPDDSRQEQVARIARRLKGMARELEVPLLVLAQLNRQADGSEEPKLSQLRESGAIEQDADVVMFVHRDDYGVTKDEREEEQGPNARLIIAKQRNGPIGQVKLQWMRDYTRFENAAWQDQNADLATFNAAANTGKF
jgi:replicative DNA helicase